MKKRFFLWGLLALATLTGRAEDVLMPQFGKQVVMVDKDNPITYYDYKGTESMKTGGTNNAFATTIFKPAQENYAIQIVFEEFELKRYRDNYDAKLYLYNGVFDTTSVT